jgi:hypothetical protein
MLACPRRTFATSVPRLVAGFAARRAVAVSRMTLLRLVRECD